jgi:hypothetical protein
MLFKNAISVFVLFESLFRMKSCWSILKGSMVVLDHLEGL